MRIVKLNDETVLLRASSITCNDTASDDYVVVFDANGLDDKGDPLAFRITLTRNELRAIARG